MLPANISLSQTLFVRKSVPNISFEISRFRIVLFKFLTDMESALNYKGSDIKYVFVRFSESCLKVGRTTGCQRRILCLRPYLCVKPYATFCTESLDSE